MNPAPPSSAHPTGEPPIRRRLRVTGTVQGVGFRPHVYALAVGLGLGGLVGNDGGGVFIEVEGPAALLDRFQAQLLADPPPLAAIERITAEPLTPSGEHTFAIAASQAQMTQRTFVAPDIALCADCRRELFDPSDRRYLYPFINCTNCGPRFTIIRSTPYDRPATTMAGFPMCLACRREYENPADRRFHAQPIACPHCGPQLTWRWNPASPLAANQSLDREGEVQRTPAALHLSRQVLAAGGIVAVKGLGGYHLACNAADDNAVALLRRRKGRADKPLAIMAANLETARRYAWIDDDEATLLSGRARPIVLLRKRAGAALAAQVAPGNHDLGVMLPYTPLHELLFHLPEGERPADERQRPPDGSAPFDLLVMTSGNLSEEPLAWRDEEALTRLLPLADGFLLHDRPIHTPCDDSVVRVFAGRELPIRRGRGYAPAPLSLAADGPPLLAVGGDLKASFCLAQGSHAILSQHIGDMGNLPTYTAFGHAIEHLQGLFRIAPEVLVCDAHPGYLSARWAQEHSAGRPVIQVQHHHAHIASLLAEQAGRAGSTEVLRAGGEPVIGFSWDGTGYGTDGAIWGGEVLVADCAVFERRAHLRYIPLPGGDAAVRRPYRSSLAHLWAAGVAWEPQLPPAAVCPPAELVALRRQLQTGFGVAQTSSMGRLFDAVAALLGVRQVVSYEAQAAVELEALLPYGIGPQLEGLGDAGFAFDLLPQDGVIVCDPAPLLRRIVAGVHTGQSRGELATGFYAALVRLIVRLSLTLRAETGLNRVGLSGGVFQSAALLAGAAAALRRQRFDVLIHRFAPPNDGGLALGQAAIARAQICRK
jgi:hydrogenase maturation protein HypF